MRIESKLKAILLMGLMISPSLAPPVAVASDSYPTRPVRMVIGFPAGQASDIVARYFAQKLTEELGQTVFVDNKPGATGIIGHDFVKNAKPDGYTILMTSGAPLAINPALYKKIPYDPVKDFAPIILTNTTPMFLAASRAVPVKNYKEMVEYVKERPGKVNYGSGGNGVTTHIVMEMFKEKSGLDLMHVPYKGSPPMMTDLIAGRVQFAFETSTAILPKAAHGDVKLLGITTSTRSAIAPEIPTLAEQGLTGFDAATWAGIVAPANTPPEIVEKLNTALNKILQRKDVVEYFHSIGGETAGGTPEDFAKFIDKELANWGQAVKASGARVD